MTETARIAEALYAGLGDDAAARAAVGLLIVGGWLDRLDGWEAYLRGGEDSRRRDAVQIDWARLREDLDEDAADAAGFTSWAALRGVRPGTDQWHAQRRRLVPERPWHGTSIGEQTLLAIAVAIAPGGLLGDGIRHLDPGSRLAVVAAFSGIAADVGR